MPEDIHLLRVRRVITVLNVCEHPSVGRDPGDGGHHRRQLGARLRRRPVRVVVVHAPHRAPPEHHLVLRQRPRLVSKQIIYLPQLLRYVQRSTLRPRVCFRIVHFDVLMYVEHL